MNSLLLYLLISITTLNASSVSDANLNRAVRASKSASESTAISLRSGLVELPTMQNRERINSFKRAASPSNCTDDTLLLRCAPPSCSKAIDRLISLNVKRIEAIPPLGLLIQASISSIFDTDGLLPPFIRSVRPFNNASLKIDPKLFSSDQNFTSLAATIMDGRAVHWAEQWKSRLKEMNAVVIHNDFDVSGDFLNDFRDFDDTILEINVQNSTNLASIIQFLSNQKVVTWLEPRFLFHTSDSNVVTVAPPTPSPPITSRLRAERAWLPWFLQSGVEFHTPLWDAQIDGSGEIVAVTDTGIDETHCAFADEQRPHALTTNVFDGTRRKLLLKEVGNSGQPARDYDGHGTAMASIAFGRAEALNSSRVSDREQAVRIARSDSLAFNAKGTSIDVGLYSGPDEGEGLWLLGYTHYHYVRSYDNGARIFSNSFGDGVADYNVVDSSIDGWVYRMTDALVLVAAGNQGDASGSVEWSTKNAVVVGASESGAEHLSEWFGYPVLEIIRLDSNAVVLSLYAMPDVRGPYMAPPYTYDAPLYRTDPLSTGCTPVQTGLLQRAHHIVARGECTFAAKLVAARASTPPALTLFVVNTQNSEPTRIRMDVGNVTLSATESITPAWMLAYTDTQRLLNDLSLLESSNIHVAGRVRFRPLNTQSGSEQALATFSGRGPAQGSRVAPLILVPGYPVHAALSRDRYTLVAAERHTHQACGPASMSWISGTSPATALAASVAALLRQYFRQGKFPSGAVLERANEGFVPTAALLMATLVQSGVPVRSRRFGEFAADGDSAHAPTYTAGFGRVALHRALPGLTTAAHAPFAASKHSPTHLTVCDSSARCRLQEGQMARFCFRVPSTYVTETKRAEDFLFPTPVRVTLAWLDPQAYAGAEHLLVNNLDLVVRVASRSYVGNSPLYGARTDTINNVERVVLSTHPSSQRLQPGQLLAVEVHAIRVSTPTYSSQQATQNFSLIVSGELERVNALAQCTAADQNALRSACVNGCNAPHGGNCVNGQCQCVDECTGVDCSSSASDPLSRCSRLPTIPPTVSLTPPPSPVNPTPHPPTLMPVTPITPPPTATCQQCLITFGAVGTDRWCQCCAQDCGGYRRDCIEKNKFCLDKCLAYSICDVLTQPTLRPTPPPTFVPTTSPTRLPSFSPTSRPTETPSRTPTESPSGAPSATPTWAPTAPPSTPPSVSPSRTPTLAPRHPTQSPSNAPSRVPTYAPTQSPSYVPTSTPTALPTHFPSSLPTVEPTQMPTKAPSHAPTSSPFTVSPTISPSFSSSTSPLSDFSTSMSTQTNSAHSSSSISSSSSSPTSLSVFSSSSTKSARTDKVKEDSNSQWTSSAPFIGGAIGVALLSAICVILMIVCLVRRRMTKKDLVEVAEGNDRVRRRYQVQSASRTSRARREKRGEARPRL